jgi:hypothetical protein
MDAPPATTIWQSENVAAVHSYRPGTVAVIACGKRKAFAQGSDSDEVIQIV